MGHQSECGTYLRLRAKLSSQRALPSKLSSVLTGGKLSSKRLRSFNRRGEGCVLGPVLGCEKAMQWRQQE